MTSNRDAAIEKIHDIADTAKAKIEAVVESTLKAADHAADAVASTIHDAGEKIVKASE
jgi:hypothetical protein